MNLAPAKPAVRRKPALPEQRGLTSHTVPGPSRRSPCTRESRSTRSSRRTLRCTSTSSHRRSSRRSDPSSSVNSTSPVADASPPRPAHSRRVGREERARHLSLCVKSGDTRTREHASADPCGTPGLRVTRRSAREVHASPASPEESHDRQRHAHDEQEREEVPRDAEHELSIRLELVVEGAR